MGNLREEKRYPEKNTRTEHAKAAGATVVKGKNIIAKDQDRDMMYEPEDAYAPIPVRLTGNICKSRSTKSGVLVEITTRYNGTGDERYNTLVDPSTVRERDDPNSNKYNRPYVVC